MAISFKCRGCDKAYRVDDALAGKAARCRACGATMHVPGSSEGAGQGAPDLSALSMLEQAASPPQLQEIQPPPPGWRRRLSGREADAQDRGRAMSAPGGPRRAWSARLHWGVQAALGAIICIVAGCLLWGMLTAKFAAQAPGDGSSATITWHKILTWFVVFGIGLKLIITRPDPNAGRAWLFRGWLPSRATMIFLTVVVAATVISAVAHAYAAYFAWLSTFLVGGLALGLSLLAFMAAALTVDVGDFPKRSAVVGLVLVGLSLLIPPVHNTLGPGAGDSLMALPESPADRARGLEREVRTSPIRLPSHAATGAPPGPGTTSPPKSQPSQTLSENPTPAPESSPVTPPPVTTSPSVAATGIDTPPPFARNAPPPTFRPSAQVGSAPVPLPAPPTQSIVEPVLLPTPEEFAALDQSHQRLRALYMALRAEADKAQGVFPASLDSVRDQLNAELGDDIATWLARIEYLPNERVDGDWMRILVIDRGAQAGAGAFRHERALYVSVSGHVWSRTGRENLQAKLARQLARPAAPARVPMRRSDANYAMGLGNLQRLAVALMDYARDHDGRFPATLAALHDAGYVPADTSIAPPNSAAIRYIPDLNIHYPPGHIVVYTEHGGFGAGMGEHLWNKLSMDSILDRQAYRREMARQTPTPP